MASKKIKNIYKGIPEDLVDKIYRVQDEYRTNPLSLAPGGCNIVVEYYNQEVLLYDKVKYPSKYIYVILKHVVNGDISETNIAELAESKLKRVFIKNQGDYNDIWQAPMSYSELISKLKEYDENSHKQKEDKIYEIQLSNEKIVDGNTYIHLLTYNRYSIYLSLRSFIWVFFKEKDPLFLIKTLSTIYQNKENYKKENYKSDPYILDINHIYCNVDSIYLSISNTTWRQHIISELLIFDSSDMLIITKEESHEKIEKMHRRAYLLGEDSVFDFYIEDKLWAKGVDDIIFFKKESKEKKTLSNKEVLAMDKCTSTFKFVVKVAEGFGMDNIFIENEFGEPILEKDSANEILEALDITKIE
jgi:hypothetical protein